MLNGLDKSLEKHLPESERLSVCAAQAGRGTAQRGSSFSFDLEALDRLNPEL